MKRSAHTPDKGLSPTQMPDDFRTLRRKQMIAQRLADKKKFRQNALAVLVLILLGFLFGGPIVGLVFAVVGGAVLSGSAVSGGFGGGGGSPI